VQTYICNINIHIQKKKLRKGVVYDATAWYLWGEKQDR
jgi:hypothetical protein